MSIENLKRLLNILFDIAFESDTDIDQINTYIIYEPSAIETCYKILVYYFKNYPAAANDYLKPYVTFPLRTTKNSLFNSCILTRVFFPCIVDWNSRLLDEGVKTS